jgi:uncharacterized protein (TIGR02001 family)
MKKVVLSVVAALAVGGMAVPAVAADMPVKAKPAEPAAAPSPFDVLFGTAFTTDYELRGISQTNHKAAVQGYTELDFTAAPWLTLYTGLWGSNVSFADAEFDISGGARFSYQQFGLDVGYVYYEYPAPTGPALDGSSSISYGEFYVKPSYKVTDWLSIGGQIIGGSDFGSIGQSAWYYAGNVTVTLPQFLPAGIGMSISGDVGRQTYDSTIKSLYAFADYTTWDAGVDFNYKAITLDLRYYDTNVSSPSAAQCVGSDGSDLCDARFVATLKFDTSLSALK